MIHLGNNIARLRGFRRIPQKEIASKLDLSQQDYSKLETKAQIDDDLLERIANAIDFPVDLIKELENSSIQTVHNSGSIIDSIFYQNNPIDKLVEVFDENKKLYERLLESERQRNKQLELLLKKIGAEK